MNKLRILVTDDAIAEAFSMVLEALVATSFALAAVSDVFVLERRLETAVLSVREDRSIFARDVRPEITFEELDSVTRFIDPKISPLA